MKRLMPTSASIGLRGFDMSADEINDNNLDEEMKLERGWSCSGCGSTQSLAEIKEEFPNARSCCPERQLVRQDVLNAPKPANRVVPLGAMTRLDLSPERVLEAAKDYCSNGVVVIGLDENGEFSCSSTIADGATVLWLIERSKQKLLDV